ncbi:uncharacterized protein EAF02_001794 [Botrytis sinoallii]|uniref:uncharacterized protein n=1 Tax=Botrytis sinoallii TaxID=1463999 RepID=UPI001901836C|nr:uncharacterized protein EAF02_001794 [Botrytis sinoallii]KAF7891469.1 hypothetical protein EAF02_001794 [Botrytis sinoallii]
MTLRVEPSSQKTSTVMGITSVVNNPEEVVTQKMNILMLLNPSDSEVRSEEHSDNDMPDSKMDLETQHHQPSTYVQQVFNRHSSESIFQYQARLERTEAQNHARLNATRSGRTQLPPAPIHSRPLSFNPINAHHRFTNPYPLPPIYSLPSDRYHSQSPSHCHHHDRHQLSHRRHSQPVSRSDKKKPRSNKAYSLEEVDFIRYHKEDLNKHWPEVLLCFRKRFRGYQRESEQCLSSRYYRDNNIKMYDESGRVMRDENGRIRYISAKVRRRGTPAGRLEGIPYTLVQKHPERAMKYSWVSEQHRNEMRILAEETSDQEREQFNSLRAQQLRKDEQERGAVDTTSESIDESMDEFSGYEDSPTPSIAQSSPRSSP